MEYMCAGEESHQQLQELLTCIFITNNVSVS